MPQEIDDLVAELDHTFEVRRSITQGSANKAADALVRQRDRENALQGGRSEDLREKYGLDRM
jgi:hypothetical protein